MKRVLFITDIVVPYRTQFFNQLSKHCDLTVAYEWNNCGMRNKEWVKSEPIHFKHLFLAKERSFILSFIAFLKLIRIIHNKWDMIIIGCYNRPVEAIIMLYMRIMKIQFALNLDGESFFRENSLKQKIKKIIVNTTDLYLVAGEKAAEQLKNVVKWSSRIEPYYFSSLTQQSITLHTSQSKKREDFILVVGQFFDYKGMDIALQCAQKDKSIRYKFVGMGTRQEIFLNQYNCKEVNNVEFISFLQKEVLFEQMRKCRCLVLPSRQECWGLVINEASSFGTPIVSTWGSGAAIEFLADDYPHFLAEPDNAESLMNCIKQCLEIDNTLYSKYLIAKSKSYSIEHMVAVHMKIINQKNFRTRQS